MTGCLYMFFNDGFSMGFLHGQCRPSCGEQGTKMRMLTCTWRKTGLPAWTACRFQPRPNVKKLCKLRPCPRTLPKGTATLCQITITTHEHTHTHAHAHAHTHTHTHTHTRTHTRTLIHTHTHTYSHTHTHTHTHTCLLYTSPSPRDQLSSRMPSSA